LFNGRYADNKNKTRTTTERSITVTTAFVVLLILGASGALLIGYTRHGRERFIDDYVFPAGIRQRVRKRYPHLTEAQLDLVFDALREYFHLCRKAGRRMLAMPSQVVDVAWHEFILFTRNYRQFCLRAFGRFLHHTPTEAMNSPTLASDGIKRTWRLACTRAAMKPDNTPVLPLLFAIDGRLAIPDGFRYVPDCSRHLAAADGTATYCASHIGCGGGCAGGGCSSDGGGDGGCGGGGD
jgi:hypothetical protein